MQHEQPNQAAELGVQYLEIIDRVCATCPISYASGIERDWPHVKIRITLRPNCVLTEILDDLVQQGFVEAREAAPRLGPPPSHDAVTKKFARHETQAALQLIESEFADYFSMILIDIRHGGMQLTPCTEADVPLDPRFQELVQTGIVALRPASEK